MLFPVADSEEKLKKSQELLTVAQVNYSIGLNLIPTQQGGFCEIQLADNIHGSERNEPFRS